MFAAIKCIFLGHVWTVDHEPDHGQWIEFKCRRCGRHEDG